MQADIKLMVKIFNTTDIDWMGDEIIDVNFLTKHHIVKKEDGGANDISNYALLTPRSHHLIHYLEENYNKEYIELNKLFQELNLTLSPPTVEYYEKVKRIIKRVKKDMKNKNRNRGNKRHR
jgi:hypothetical protein